MGTGEQMFQQDDRTLLLKQNILIFMHGSLMKMHFKEAGIEKMMDNIDEFLMKGYLACQTMLVSFNNVDMDFLSVCLQYMILILQTVKGGLMHDNLRQFQEKFLNLKQHESNYHEDLFLIQAELLVLVSTKLSRNEQGIRQICGIVCDQMMRQENNLKMQCSGYQMLYEICTDSNKIFSYYLDQVKQITFRTNQLATLIIEEKNIVQLDTIFVLMQYYIDFLVVLE